MTGYLALDPERVARLADALVTALDEATRWPLSDPAAADARLAVRRAVAAFDGWPERVTRAAGCGALTDLFSWSAAPAGFPGHFVADPVLVLTHADRMVLVHALVERWRELLLDVGSLDVGEWLDALGDLRGDPAAMAELLLVLGPSAVLGLLTGLARRLRADPNLTNLGGTGPAEARAVLELIGQGWAALGDRPGWLTLLTGADPVVAAHLLAGAVPAGAAAGRGGSAIPAEAVTLVLGDLLARAPSDPLWWGGATNVLRALRTDPGLGRDVFLALEPSAQERLVLRTDPVLMGDVLLGITDPATFGPDEVEPVLLRLVEILGAYGKDTTEPVIGGPPMLGADGALSPWQWLLDDDTELWLPQPLAGVPVGIGAVFAPWTMHLLAPVLSGTWRPDSVTPFELGDRHDLLAQTMVVVTADAAEATAVVATAHSYLGLAATSSADDLRHAAYTLGAIEDAARSARYEALVAHEHSRESTSTAIGALAALAPIPVAGLGGAALGAALGLGVEAVTGRGPVDLRTAAARAETDGVRISVVAGLGALSVWRQVHAPGSAPLPALAPPAAAPRPGDRADKPIAAGRGGAGGDRYSVAAAVVDWATTELSPSDAHAALEVYEQARLGALEGTAFAVT